MLSSQHPASDITPHVQRFSIINDISESIPTRRRNQDIPQKPEEPEHRIKVYLDIAKPAAAKAQNKQ
jgi:hypothetical protein